LLYEAKSGKPGAAGAKLKLDFRMLLFAFGHLRTATKLNAQCGYKTGFESGNPEYCKRCRRQSQSDGKSAKSHFAEMK
jgi:hypothetical protein